jgi:hypothetical protein
MIGAFAIKCVNVDLAGVSKVEGRMSEDVGTRR